jgi:hypothetical protein
LTQLVKLDPQKHTREETLSRLHLPIHFVQHRLIVFLIDTQNGAHVSGIAVERESRLRERAKQQWNLEESEQAGKSQLQWFLAKLGPTSFVLRAGCIRFLRLLQATFFSEYDRDTITSTRSLEYFQLLHMLTRRALLANNDGVDCFQFKYRRSSQSDDTLGYAVL